MDRQYKYQFTPLAEQDLNEIFDYISLELFTPLSAEKLIERIQTAVERVCEFPFSCPLLNDAILREREYRLLVVDNFNLFYIVRDETVIIMRVLYGRRNYESLL